MKGSPYRWIEDLTTGDPLADRVSKSIADAWDEGAYESEKHARKLLDMLILCRVHINSGQPEHRQAQELIDEMLLIFPTMEGRIDKH